MRKLHRNLYGVHLWRYGAFDPLRFEIALEVEFWANEVKDHAKTKALMETLKTEIDQLVKKNPHLTKALDESVEQRSSSEQDRMRQITQDLETFLAEV